MSSWQKEFSELWDALVPAEGQAETLQGELVRIAGKLTDQAYRNGNMNWDRDHERMWRFVGQRLDDPQTFSAVERALIRAKIEEIIRDYVSSDVSGEGSCYYIISEKVVDWCRAHPTPIVHRPDPTLGR